MFLSPTKRFVEFSLTKDAFVTVINTIGHNILF
jgi:hypothetical protein